MVRLGDGCEGGDKAVGGAAGRPNRHTEIGVWGPEIDRRDQGCREDQKARGQKQRRAQDSISSFRFRPALKHFSDGRKRVSKRLRRAWLSLPAWLTPRPL